MIITKTPLRASLFGGGTDFYEYFTNSKYGYGHVISMGLNMHVYITINKRFDDNIRIVYSGNEFVDDVEKIKHNIIREAMKLTGVYKGIEVIYMSDLPMTNLGVGLASSSALAVGVLNALHSFKGEYVDKKQLAKEAIEIEINKLGQQIGIQDQYAVSFGGFNHYIFNANDTISITPTMIDSNRLNEFVNHFILFWTGSARDSKQIFVEQKQTTKNKKEILDDLVEITNEAIKYINNNEYDKIGELLDNSWKIKKQFAKNVSNEQIDNMYNRAIKAGAIGGKVLGAGGGGFLLVYSPIDKKNNIKNELSEYKNFDLDVDMQGSRVIFVD